MVGQVRDRCALVGQYEEWSIVFQEPGLGVIYFCLGFL